MSIQILRLERSNRKHKKYIADVVIDNTIHHNIHFGDTRYGSVAAWALGTLQQYKDSTPLKLYSHLDHLDPERRRLYHKRHISNGPASQLSKHFLW